MLDDFFCSFDCSIRLLRLKGKATTFTNISPTIELLTDRKFTYSHLAQLKFILPEAIEVKKILTLDERTSCMKPDLLLDLNATAIENLGGTESESGNLYLREAFRARLCDYHKAHPDEDEIPEEELPEPFNQSKICLEINSTRTSVSPCASQTPVVAPSEQQRGVVLSHLPYSFRRCFSQQVSDHKVVNTHQEGIEPVSEPVCSANETSLAKLPFSPPPATPVKD